MSRDHHKIKDDLDEKMDEINIVRDELKSTKELLSSQISRPQIILTSSPIQVEANRKDSNLSTEICE